MSGSGQGSASNSGEESISVRVAKMVEEETNREYLSHYAGYMETATTSEKRRIRDEACQKGREAYAAALERIVQTTETEKQALQLIFETYVNDQSQLVAHLRSHGFRFND